jgi:hypothetical protein
MKTMRNFLVSVIILLAACSFSFATNSKSQDVKITPIENTYLGKSVEKAWTISYSAEKSLTVTMRTVGMEKEYVVHSKFFEVLYVAGKRGFGVKDMPGSLREVPEQITSSVLNKQQLENQKILTADEVSDANAIELIANYLPDLLNEGYKHLLY